MTEHSQPSLIGSLTFPPQVQLPDIAGYTGSFFSLKTNPHWQQVEAESYAWFDSYGIYSGIKRQKYFDSAFGLMGALAFADADLERLRPSMDFVLWLFAFDNLTDESELCNDAEAVGRIIEVAMKTLRDPEAPVPDIKIVACLQSFVNRMRPKASPAAMQRLIDATDLYTRASLQQTANRSIDVVPTVEEFIQLRRDSSAVKLAYPIIEYSLDLDLPAEVHSDPMMVELKEAGNDLLTWANDVYSFPPELARGDTQNLVFIAMQEKRLDLAGAIEYVNQMIHTRMDEYQKAKAQLRSFGPELDAQIAQYIQGIEYCVQGSIDWTFMTPRYFGADAKKVRETHVVEIVTPQSAQAVTVEA